MPEASGVPKKGTVTIDWTAGFDPQDVATYAWRVQCEPPLPDEVLAALLSEVANVH
jgi:hypothetical protein